MTLEELRQAAYRADDAFSDALVRAYGAARAGDARYQQRHDDPAVERAGREKVAADRAYDRAYLNAPENAVPAVKPDLGPSFDYEGAILDEQEDFRS